MTTFQGRLMHILAAKRQPNKAGADGPNGRTEGETVGFRAERQAQKKADAGEGASGEKESSPKSDPLPLSRAHS